MGDNSNTQFALLALNEAERVGVKVIAQHVAVGPRVLGKYPAAGRFLGLSAW